MKKRISICLATLVLSLLSTLSVLPATASVDGTMPYAPNKLNVNVSTLYPVTTITAASTYTGSAVSVNYYKSITVVPVVAGTATTVFTTQMSIDKVNWFGVGVAFTFSTTGSQYSTFNILMPYLRTIITKSNDGVTETLSVPFRATD